MSQPPEAWAVRVMEALMSIDRSAHPIWWVSRDEVVTEVLLRMRVGEFAPHNKNAFKRYNADIFRCHICNHKLPENSRAPNTTAHLDLHRRQVRYILDPSVDCPSWEHTDEPTEEEVRALDDQLQRRSDRIQAQARGFDIIHKPRRTP